MTDTRLRTPERKSRPWRRLQGAGTNYGLGAGQATANGGVRYELVPVFGQSVLTARIKVATNGGTLDVVFVGPDFAPDQGDLAFASLVGTKYTTGNPTQVAVAAGTEAIISAVCLGEGYALLKYTGAVGAGAITYCDVVMADAPVITEGVTVISSENLSQVAGTAVATGTGTANAGTQRVAVSSDSFPTSVTDGSDPTLGATTDVGVVTDAVGSVNGHLRGLVAIQSTPYIVPSANFTRPADTTAYAVGDLVANNTTAASVVPLSWTVTRAAATALAVIRARLKKSTTSVTNAAFRLHLYSSDPSASTGISNGDNGAWLTKEAGYLGYIDITVDKVFSDAAHGDGCPGDATGTTNPANAIIHKLASGSTIYGLIEARGAYTPGNAEVFTVILEVGN